MARRDMLSSGSAPFLEATMDLSSSSFTDIGLYHTSSYTGAGVEGDWRSVQV